MVSSVETSLHVPTMRSRISDSVWAKTELLHTKNPARTDETLFMGNPAREGLRPNCSDARVSRSMPEIVGCLRWLGRFPHRHHPRLRPKLQMPKTWRQFSKTVRATTLRNGWSRERK